MPIQPAAGLPLPATALVGRAFPRSEWRLLTALPAHVVAAATAISTDGQPGAVNAGLAGLDALAGGRVFDSDLVRAVVAEIYAASEGSAPAPLPFAHRTGTPVETALTTDCRRAVGILELRADPADSAAYRLWVHSIAVRACGVSAGCPGTPERGFLAELAGALRLR